MRVALLALLLAGCTDTGDTREARPQVDQAVRLDAPIAQDARFAEGQLIVGFHSPTDARTLNLPASLGGQAMERLRDWTFIDAALYELPPGVDVRQAVEALRETGAWLYVEPDYERRASSVDDPYRSYQWNFDSVNAESAWAYSTGSGAIVAVLDTGATSGPYDGIGNLGSGYDFVNTDSDPADDEGHGTHVSGTIAAATNNTAGVAGLAYDATIMPIKVLDATGSGYTSDIISGISYAVSNGADVINMSLGSTSSSSSEASAVASAYSSGLFIACASGNSGASTVEYPAAYPYAVAVGATDYSDTRVYYSTYGSALDLMAPGGDIYLDDNSDGFADGVLQETFESGTWAFYFWDGTSMATPHVAAAAALLMANGATNAEAETYLSDYATDLGSSGWDSSNGWGLIQPDAALAAWDADHPDTGLGCTTTVTTATYTASLGELVTYATATSSSETLTASADVNELGTLTWSGTSSQFEETWTWPVAPDEVSVSSDCGDSDTLTVTVN